MPNFQLVGLNEFPRGKLRGIKPCRSRIDLKVIRAIRVICEICGLNFPNEASCGELNPARLKYASIVSFNAIFAIFFGSIHKFA